MVRTFDVLITGLALCLFSSLFAGTKVGFVNKERLISEYSALTTVQNELDKEQQAIEAEYHRLKMQLDSLSVEFDKLQFMMSETRREEKEKELSNLGKQLKTFQLDKFGPKGEIFKAQDKLLKKVLLNIEEAIKVVAAEKGFDLVLDIEKSGIIFANDYFDLTEDVLKELQQISTTN